MDIATNIISAVLKAVVSNKVGNGLMKELVDISIGEVSEKSIEKINDFICGEKSKFDYILSKNNMLFMGISNDYIDYVIAEIKDLLSWIEVTDEIFRQCKYESSNLRDFLWDKYIENENGYVECEDEIKKGLLIISDALIKLMYASENFEKEILSRIDISIDNVNVEVQKISKYLEDNIYKLDADNQIIIDILLIILKEIQNLNLQNKDAKKKIKSRTQEYADKWNENMFLNDFDEWDENAGVNVKLSDVYLDKHLPHFIWGKNRNESTNIKEFLTKYMKESKKNKMLLILGQPGIGKSTLITWITANFSERIDEILVYQFASDLKSIEWERHNLSKRILEELGLSPEDLEGKVLILDGFDEVNVIGDRKGILDQLYWDLIKEKFAENFSLIITCRLNCIYNLKKELYNYIVLQSWNEEQIKSFCTVFQNKVNMGVSECTIKNLLKNREALGIPLILYMVLSLNISVENESSIVDIYDKIFSLDGGIYDRSIENKRYVGGNRIGEIKVQIHKISRKIAIWMFEHEPEEVYIPYEEYQKICEEVLKEENCHDINIKQDALSGNFFKILKHYEVIEEELIYFIHRTIYEYFVAESMYSFVEKALIDVSEESFYEFAKNLANHLKKGKITDTIKKYFLHKVLKLYNRVEDDEKAGFYQRWEVLISKMMEYGIFYYTNKNVKEYKNIMESELICFRNLMEISRGILGLTSDKYIMKKVNNNILEKYVKYGVIKFNIDRRKDEEDERINLSKIYLCNTNLRGVDYFGINFWGANLEGANFKETNLRRASFKEANLKGTNFEGADLRRAKFEGADLQGANLKDAILYSANFRKANLVGAYLSNSRLTDIDLYEAKLGIMGFAYIKQFEHMVHNFKNILIYIDSTDKYITYKEFINDQLYNDMFNF